MFFKKLRRMQAERYAAWRASQPWLVPEEDEARFMRREARQIHEMELSMNRTGNYKTAEKMRRLIDDYKRRAGERTSPSRR
jgi:hypothetical protein